MQTSWRAFTTIMCLSALRGPSMHSRRSRSCKWKRLLMAEALAPDCSDSDSK